MSNLKAQMTRDDVAILTGVAPSTVSYVINNGPRSATVPKTNRAGAHNDLMAIGAIKAFTEVGLKVPVDISVVGFDDITAASYVQPPLTTIAFPKRQMGKDAIEVKRRAAR